LLQELLLELQVPLAEGENAALDLALDKARQVEADLVIANDPDADRCSAAIPDEDAPGGWRQLTGDEVGALLGEQAAELAAFAGTGALVRSSTPGGCRRPGPGG